MRTVVVTIATSTAQFPAGTNPAGLLISIPGQPSQTVSAAPYVATFANVAAGTYTATAQAVDASGNPLGTAVTSASFQVAADTVAVDLPVTITLAVQ